MSGAGPAQPAPARAAVEIDARGLLCPLPVLRLRKRLLALPEGTEVVLLATDRAASIDVPHFCAETGHVFLGESMDAGGARRFRVRCRAQGEAHAGG